MTAKKTAKKTSKPAKATKATKASVVDPTSDASLQALASSYAAPPDIPVSIQAAELASLARLARARAAVFATIGVDDAKLTHVASFARRLSALERAWQKLRASVRLTAAEKKLRDEAELLDRKLVAGGRWALRGDAAAQAELSRIAEGSGLADTVQDLKDLVTFWGEHPDEQAAGQVSATNLARATTLAESLEAAAAKESADVAAASAIELRNRCFWAGDELASEVRAGGRFAFRDEPKVAAKFVSRYRASQSRRQRKRGKGGGGGPTAPVPTPGGGTTPGPTSG